jgi:hypothetical protein
VITPLNKNKLKIINHTPNKISTINCKISHHPHPHPILPKIQIPPPTNIHKILPLKNNMTILPTTINNHQQIIFTHKPSKLKK